MKQPSFLIRLLIFTGVSYAAELESSDPGWPFWGGNLNNTRSTSLSTLVNQTSVANLTVVFNVALLGPVSASPFVHGSSVVVPTWAGRLYSLDSLTGIVKWQRSVDDYVANSLCDRPTEYNFTEGPTGVIARTTPALAAPDLIVIGTQVADPLVAGLPYIMGKPSSKVPRKSSRASPFRKSMSRSSPHCRILDASGSWCRLADQQPFAVITASGTAYNGSYFIGVSSEDEVLPVEDTFFRGSFLRVNALDGTTEWQTFLEPEVDEGYAGVAVWGSMFPIDPIRQQVYVATGNNYKVPPAYTECQLQRSTTVDECGLPDNYANSIVALDLDTGDISWSVQLGPLESWVYSCISSAALNLNLSGVDIYLPASGVDLSDPDQLTFGSVGLPADLLPPGCPPYPGVDADFAQAPMLTYVPTLDADLLLIANKGGFAFAVDPDTGGRVWATAVGPGGYLGGSMFGSATDGERMYVAINSRPYPSSPAPVLSPSPGSPNTTLNGLWAALDSATGTILWETPSPLAGSMAGQLTVANGVLFGTTSSGDDSLTASLFALNVTDGTILTAVTLNNTLVQNGPSIVNNLLYQGAGYDSINGSVPVPTHVPTTFWAFTPAGNPAFPHAPPAQKLANV
ncbi:TPA: hypothetical protein ACH3X2_008409 [Trebouxia sp. C0005]